jgi:hypothetical protein
MKLPRGKSNYGPRSDPLPRPSVRYSGSEFIGMLEVPCFALVDVGEATSRVMGRFGNEEATERRCDGNQSSASRTFGGVTIQHVYPSDASAFVTSEKQVNWDVSDWRTRQRYLASGLVTLSNEYRDFGSTNVVDELEWKTVVIDVVGMSAPFEETRLPSSHFDDARLLVGRSNATMIAIVASNHSMKLALREVTASDFDRWLEP